MLRRNNAQRVVIVLPSSNSVLESLAARGLVWSETTFHFSRLGLIDITLSQESQAQFILKAKIDAGKLLCDADVDCVVWGGTSASWLGLEHDLDFCTSFTQKMGTPAGSCVLEMNRILANNSAKTFGLVTPYTTDVQEKIIENYERLGFLCAGEQHHGGVLSNDYASIDPETVAQMLRVVARKGPDVILIMCTNMFGSTIAEPLTIETGILVIDSASVTLQAGMCLAKA